MVNRNLKLHDHTSPQPRHELLQVADVVAREKGIEREEVIVAMEQAILKAARAKFGVDHDICVTVDRSTGGVTLEKHITVVEDALLENEVTQIPLTQVQRNPDLNHYGVGDVIVYPLPPIEFGRVTAQSARQVIVQKVREAERTKIFDEFQGRVGHLISGVVKRVEFGNVILDIGRGEAIMKRDDVIPRESFQAGDRIRVYVTGVDPHAKGPMISVSRTHSWFMARLFEQEVPEIYDGIIEVKAIARDPGSRAKMAVFSPDNSIDPVGACVGMRGTRVQAVVSELQGEKVDIIPWSSNPATFVVNALAPAEATKVVIDEDAHRVDVVVPEDQLSLAIGRRGQNVRLASQLTGWNIDILTEAQEAERRTTENGARIALFMEGLDVDDMIAQLLVAEGFMSIDEIASIDVDEFSAIEGFDEDIAQELQRRAALYQTTQNTQYRHEAKQLGASEDLLSLEGISPRHLLCLVQNEIKTRDDIADLSGDELRDILADDELSLDHANAIIMKAREHWFE